MEMAGVPQTKPPFAKKTIFATLKNPRADKTTVCQKHRFRHPEKSVPNMTARPGCRTMSLNGMGEAPRRTSLAPLASPGFLLCLI